jgi:hypothetical protein
VLLQKTVGFLSVYNNSSNQEDLNPSSEGTPLCGARSSLSLRLLVYVSFASNTDPAVVQQAADNGLELVRARRVCGVMRLDIV